MLVTRVVDTDGAKRTVTAQLLPAGMVWPEQVSARRLKSARSRPTFVTLAMAAGAVPELLTVSTWSDEAPTATSLKVNGFGEALIAAVGSAASAVMTWLAKSPASAASATIGSSSA